MKQKISFSMPGYSAGFLRSIFSLLLIAGCFFLPATVKAQCGAGYNQVTLDWDYLDYFSYSGNYTTSASNSYLTSNAQAQTQVFAFGTQRVTITHGYSAAGNLGENALHTGDAGSYGIGSQDINFTGNGTITFTFDNEVENVKFSIYDLDNSQSATVTAVNAASVAQLVTMAKTNGASALVIVGSGTVSAVATSLLVGAQGNASTTASLNIDIAGPVKSFTINTGGTAGDFWISNVLACSVGTFPNAYHLISKPFTGQPGYVLTALDKSVYMVNPATGFSKLIFTDPTGNINSMGYDPYNRILYYVYSLTSSPGTNTAIKKYDFNTKTISTALADVRTIGIPLVTLGSSSAVYGSGVESGAASFYNGSLFLGIETTNKNSSGIVATSGRECVIWRIDFDVTNTPYRSSQVFALPNDNGSGTLMHDWSDFVVTNGMIYDFDGAGVTTQTDVNHFDMMAGTNVNYALPSGWTPGQPAVDWQEKVYQLFATANAPAVNPYIALYNQNGTIGTRFNLSSSPMFSPAIPSLGDAAEAFRPFADFGDAPASFDPTTGDPAVHEVDANIRLGSAESDEYVTRGQTTLANSDNNDDAIGAAPNLNFGGILTYTVSNISVYNNTGANATLIAWLDYNFNGIFDAGEGRSVTIPTSASVQTTSVSWTAIGVPATALTKTYLRIRFTKAANGMTVSNSIGYMPDGEVEDYPVVMGISLPVAVTAFDVQKANGKTASLAWTVTGNMAENAAFEIERSSDAQQWTKIGAVNTYNINATTDQFSFNDDNALSGKSFYRIKIVSKDGAFKHTDAKSISFSYLKGKIVVSPNPVTDYVNIQLTSENNMLLKISVFDYAGKILYEKNASVIAGSNNIKLTDLKTLTTGVYYIKLNLGEESFTEKLIVNLN